MATATPPAAPVVKQPQVLMEWVAPSHFAHERSNRWYVIGGIVVLIVAAYAILTGAWTVALVSLLAGGVTFLVRREPTPLKYIRIESDGFEFQNEFTPWSQCKEFWLVQTPLFTELHILRTSGFQREICLHTGNIDPAVIRSTVSQFLPIRADRKERLLDVIIRICKL